MLLFLHGPHLFLQFGCFGVDTIYFDLRVFVRSLKSIKIQ